MSKCPELRLLSAFRSFVDAGGVVEGAKREGVSQPTLSGRLVELEKELGAKLFVFRGKKKELTPFGVEVKKWADEEIVQIEAKYAELKQRLANPSRLRLKIGCRADRFAFVSDMLKMQGQLQWLNLSGHDALDALEDGKVDLAVVHELPKSSRWVVKKLFKSTPYFVAHVNLLRNIPVKQAAHDPRFLEATPCVAYNQAHMGSWFERLGVPSERVCFKHLGEDWDSVRRWVQRGEGYSILPGEFLPSTDKHGQVAFYGFAPEEFEVFQYFIVFSPELRGYIKLK